MNVAIVILSVLVVGLGFLVLHYRQLKKYVSNTLILTNDNLNAHKKISKDRGATIYSLGQEIESLKEYVESLSDEVQIEKKKYSSLLSQKKSSEVNTGLIGEQLAPFLQQWPYDLKTFRFIGYPIDGIQVNDDGLIIIEIKTGNSRLSKQQKKIRDFVKEGKVYFEVFRIHEKGCKLTRCDNIGKDR